jgi:hypothetical protein
MFVDLVLPSLFSGFDLLGGHILADVRLALQHQVWFDAPCLDNPFGRIGHGIMAGFLCFLSTEHCRKATGLSEASIDA